MVSMATLVRLPRYALAEELDVNGIKYPSEATKEELARILLARIAKDGKLFEHHSAGFLDLVAGLAPVAIPSGFIHVTSKSLESMSVEDILAEAKVKKIKLPDNAPTKRDLIIALMRGMVEESKLRGEIRDNNFVFRRNGGITFVQGPYSLAMQRNLLLESCRSMLGIRVLVHYRGGQWDITLTSKRLAELDQESLVQEAFMQGINFSPKDTRESIADRLMLFYQTKPKEVRQFGKPVRILMLKMVQEEAAVKAAREGGPLVPAVLLRRPDEARVGIEAGVGTGGARDIVSREQAELEKERAELGELDIKRAIRIQSGLVPDTPEDLKRRELIEKQMQKKIGDQKRRAEAPVPGSITHGFGNDRSRVLPAAPPGSPDLTSPTPQEGALSITSTPGGAITVGSTPVQVGGGQVTPTGQPAALATIAAGQGGALGIAINPSSVPTTFNNGQLTVGGQTVSFVPGPGGPQVMINQQPAAISPNGLLQTSGGAPVMVSVAVSCSPSESHIQLFLRVIREREHLFRREVIRGE